MKRSCSWKALTIGSRGPQRSLSGAPPGVEWWPGVQDVGAGGGVLLACLNRALCRLPAWLPLSALVWVGRAEMKKKKCAGYSLAFPGRHTQEEGEARPDRESLQSLCLRSASDSFCYYFLNFKLSRPGMGTEGRQVTLG